MDKFKSLLIITIFILGVFTVTIDTVSANDGDGGRPHAELLGIDATQSNNLNNK